MSQALIVVSARSRHVVVTWWGSCSYRRLKVTYEVRKMCCPLCLHELEDANYFGSKVFSKDRNALDYVRDGWLPLREDGLVVWVVSPEKHTHHR
jgi:hypothetical protein